MVQLQDKVDELERDLQQSDGRKALLDWVHTHVSAWESDRNQQYLTRWMDLQAKSCCEDKNVPAETEKYKRSNLVSPALQQAVEDGAAELEEVVLGKEGWFDIRDDISGGDDEKWQALRSLMNEDMEDADVPGSLLQCFFIGALYGTLIGKLTVEDAPGAVEVGLEPVLPWHFVIDTSVNRHGKAGIAQALGMAHRLPLPKWQIRAKQNDQITDENGDVLVEATYWEVPLEPKDEPDPLAKQTTYKVYGATAPGDTIELSEDTVLITEYHGQVPQALYDAALANQAEAPEEYDSRKMIEAVVTYVNDEFLLSVRENTNSIGLRSFVSSAWDIVPGQFWGRGVGEKAFPAQKVLDIFLRGQVDAMRYHVYPIMAVNSNRVTARTNLIWGPGQSVRVQGNPQEAFFPVQMPSAGAGTFQMSANLERHIMQATGITPDAGRGERTLGGVSAIRGGFLKRMNRTIRLVSKNFLSPFIELYYTTQVDVSPDVYGEADVFFRVSTAAGMVAREHENQTLVDLIQFMPQNTPGFWAIVAQIIQNTSAKDKGDLLKALQASLQAMQQPDPTEEQSFRKEEAIITDIGARTQKTRAETLKKAAETVERGDDSGRDESAS